MLFIQKNCNSPVHLHVPTGRSRPPQHGGDADVAEQRAEAANAVSTVRIYDCAAQNVYNG